MRQLALISLVCSLACSAADPSGTKESGPAGPDDGPSDAPRLELTDIYGDDALESESGPWITWLEDGSAWLDVVSEDDREGDEAIVRVDPASGERTTLVTAKTLTLPGEEEPLTPSSLTPSDDGRKLLISTDHKRAWRSSTLRDFHVLDLESGRLHALGGPDRGEHKLSFARFSPDASRVAYVQDDDIYVETLSSGRRTRITKTGSTTIKNGRFDYANEEEFGKASGLVWSPDGKRIAYWEFDVSGVPVHTIVNHWTQDEPEVLQYPYPRPGDTNSAIRVGVVSAGGGRTTWMALPGEPRDHYVPRMQWWGNDHVLVQRMNRRQDTNKLLLGDVRTGTVTPVMTEKDDAVIEWVFDVDWLDDGAAFLWVSERSGWRHLWKVALEGGDAVDLTPGDFDVISNLGVDEATGTVYFTASPDDPKQRYLYAASTQEPGEPRRITPADAPGTHTYSLSPDRKWATHWYSRFDRPPAQELIRLPDHQGVRTLVSNESYAKKLAEFPRVEHEFFRVTTGSGVELDGYLVRPPDFDPTKKYPILFHVYGEPWGQTVTDRWHGSLGLWHRYMAQSGYVVASVDNRGTRSPRGRAWRKIVHRNIGPLSSQDQSEALVAMQDRFPYLDGDRVGVWGHSGGGSMTLNLLFRYPEQYHVGIAVASVPDQKLYDSIYQERYSGLLGENEDAYRAGSPITHAKNLVGKLLLIHGTADDNVHYEGAEALINELVKLNKPFDMLAYPGRRHGVGRYAGTKLHRYASMARYFLEHLPAGPR